MKTTATTLLLALALCAGGARAAGELRPGSGLPAPALTLKDTEGREHRLADYAGRVVIVNFWATWCEPCRVEMPSLNRLGRIMQDKPLVILGVSVGDSEAGIRVFRDKVPLEFAVLLDRDMGASRRWQVKALPYTWVLDGTGRIRHVAIGGLDWSAPQVVELLRALLPRASVQERAAVYEVRPGGG